MGLGVRVQQRVLWGLGGALSGALGGGVLYFWTRSATERKTESTGEQGKISEKK